MTSTFMRIRFARALALLATLAAASGLSACNDKNAVASQTPAQAPEVTTVVVEPQPRAVIRELPGRIAPTRVADVRPRVSGIIVERMFSQGSEVKAGDPLYQIDPKPFEVELQASEAALAKANAVYEQTSAQAKRIALLFQQKAVAESENERTYGAMKQAEADVAARKVDVAKARLNLDYATIRAPISGVVGAALVTEGALVVQNDPQSLATIQQLDPIYADFTQSVTELNNLKRSLASGEFEVIAPEEAKVRLILDNDIVYPFPGKLLFSDAKVDAQTGQVTLRGQFPNPARDLLPGMYVRVQIEQGIDTDAILIPQQAVQRNGGGGSEVFLVKDDGLVAIQQVRTGSTVENDIIVTDGLKGGDRVVIDGFQKFVAGDKVNAQPLRKAGDAQQTTQLKR